MPTSPEHFAENIARFTGFADLYERHRPSPPAALAALVAQFTGVPRPAVAVDLGSGTGLSTRYWAQHAGRVIGIEPTPDMRRVAEAATRAENVSYRAGFSHDTGLPERSAQVISCMQSLHWMEPPATFAEAARVLVNGGVFVACDYDWPPASGAWEGDAAWENCLRRGRQLEKERATDAGLRHWEKSGHYGRMQASGCFRYVKEALVHHTDFGNAERLVGVLLSQGYIAKLLRDGVSESDLGIDALREIAERTLGAAPRPWFWSARVRLGVV